MGTMADTCRIFHVHVFSADDAVLEVNVPATPSAIKHAVGRHFELKPKSLKIFGIFTGALRSPTALLSESQAICSTISKVAFQRVSFDAELEVSIASDDVSAVKLLFEELRYEYNQFRVFPIVTSEQMQRMDRILANESLLSSEGKLEKQVELFNLICNQHSLYFWSYYFRVENCILQTSSLPISSLVAVERKLHAALSPGHLILLEPLIVGGKEILKLPWSKVRSVRMQRSPAMLVKFETLVPMGQGEHKIQDELMLISLETDRNEYLYTLTQYVLKWHEVQKFQGFLAPPVSVATVKAEMNPRNYHCYVNHLFSKSTT